MSDDLLDFAETREELKGSIDFIEGIIGSAKEGDQELPKFPSESIRKIPKGIVSSRKGLYGGATGKSGRRSARGKVRFEGMGADIDEEADGEEDDNREDDRPAKQEGRRRPHPERSGAESTQESEGPGSDKEDIETAPKKTDLFLMEAQARKVNLDEPRKKTPPKFLPSTAFPAAQTQAEPLYVDPIDYGVKLTAKARRSADHQRATNLQVRLGKLAAGLEEDVSKLKSITESRAVEPEASTSKGLRLEKLSFGLNTWPGFGPFDELLKNMKEFKLDFATDFLAPFVTATRLEMKDEDLRDPDWVAESLCGIKAMCLSNMKMIMDERGNRDLLLVLLNNVAKVQESVDTLSRQVMNLTAEQSSLKSTLSDLYVILDRSTGDITDDSTDDTAVAATKRSKTGRVTLDRVAGESASDKDKFGNLIALRAALSPLNAPRLDPSRTNATTFVPTNDPVSATVIHELIETDAVAVGNKAVVRRMVAMSRDAKTLTMIHTSIINGRYK